MDPAAFAPPGDARVAVVSASSYDGDLSPVVRDGLRAVGADLNGANVLLKPNFVEFDSGSVINTDPRLVAATVLAVRRMGASSVTVGEGPGHRRDTGYVVRSSGLADALAVEVSVLVGGDHDRVGRADRPAAGPEIVARPRSLVRVSSKLARGGACATERR